MKSSARILVVDDSSMSRSLVDAILGSEGHELVHAETGERALEIVALGGIDLVLIDVVMPGIDGIETCRRIRDDLDQRLLPIVILGAFDDTESRSRGRAAGADDFLSKPIDQDELIARVRNLLLVRAYYTLSEEHRERAEAEAERWRDRSDAAVRTAEERNRVLFDASPMPSWVFDPVTLRFLVVNEALIRMIGYSREELLTMRMVDLKAPSDLPRLVAGMVDLTVGIMTHVGIMQYRCKDTRVIELDITSHAMMLDGSLALLVVGIDVTHSRRMEEQLRQAQKMEAIGQLAGGVAHDFNNILAAILANVELARDQISEHHPVVQEISEIETAAHRAVALTRQLLTFSRQQRREVKSLTVSSVVTNVEKMLTRIVGEDVEITTVPVVELGTIEADVGQLEQLLVNLAVNSRDAMPNGGRLTIETTNAELESDAASRLGIAPGPYVVLAVSDTGCGMDAATQAHIFEPFFTTKEVGKGTGLGLSTVFGIVKQSGGAIAVCSEPGRGSTFTVYFPRIDGVAEAVVARSQRIATLRSGTVLVVEDDEMLRKVIRRQLTSWGYSLLEARNGAAALELLRTRREPIDLLFTDLVMPGIDGRALAREVLVAHPGTKVLFMSGYTEHAAVKTAALGPVEHFIQKPFTGTTLSYAIVRAMGTETN